MTERGYIDHTTLKTKSLPTSGASAGNILAISGIDERTCVAVGLHFTKGIKYAVTTTSASAIAKFSSENHGRFLSQASPIELQFVGDRSSDDPPLKLYIERLSGAAEANGISFYLVRGREQ